MRFNQLKKNPNFIEKKKMYKKGTQWVVESVLTVASGALLLGTNFLTVSADTVSTTQTADTLQINNQQKQLTRQPEVPDQTKSSNVTNENNQEVATKLTMTTNIGDITMDVNGRMGETVIVDVPQKEGYTSNVAQINVVINTDGTASSNDVVSYSPINKVQQNNLNVTNNTNDKNELDDNRNNTSNEDSVTSDNQKSIDTSLVSDDDTQLPYGTKVTTDGKISSNIGTQTVKNVTGNVGDIVTVTVPLISGYTANRSTINLNVNYDGTIGGPYDDTVIYTPTDRGFDASQIANAGMDGTS